MPPIDSDTSRVRLLISDVGGEDGESFVFSDNEIETLLELRRGNVFLAASLALETLANNEAQVAKRIRFLDLETDGPSVAIELRRLAQQLYERGHEAAGVRIGQEADD